MLPMALDIKDGTLIGSSLGNGYMGEQVRVSYLWISERHGETETKGFDAYG